MRSLWTATIYTSVYWFFSGLLVWEVYHLPLEEGCRRLVECCSYVAVGLCGAAWGCVYADEEHVRQARERTRSEEVWSE